MVQAQIGDRVTVHYTGKLNDGTVFDSSADRDPLEFSLGEGKVIPGFEEAIVGMSPGDSKTTTIPSDQAYGPYRQELVMAIERKQMPADFSVEVGQPVEIRHQSGQVFPAIVKQLSESEVILDANHPLAGQDLTFDLQLVEIN